MFKQINLENFIIKQDKLKNKYNEDSINLCSFIDENLSQKKIIELGCGSGLISIFIEKNFDVNEINSVEIEHFAFEALIQNININNCSKIKPHNIDIKNLKNKFNHNSYDLIITNPPFFKIGKGKLSNNHEKLLARHEFLCNMKDIFHISSALLRIGGYLILCYPMTRHEEVTSNSADFGFVISRQKLSKKIIFYSLIKD